MRPTCGEYTKALYNSLQARSTLKNLKEDEVKSYYLSSKHSAATVDQGEERTNEEIKQAHEEYEAAYRNYNLKKRIQHELMEEANGPPSFMLAEKDPPKQKFPGIIDFTKVVEERQQQEFEALKDAERKRMNGQTVEILTPQSAAMIGLNQGLENIENSDSSLENVNPQIPDYFSKHDQTVTYLSRFSFLVKVAAPEREAAILGILFGGVAIVLAISTAGKSLYLLLLAGAEVGIGVMQIKINSDKLRDLGKGNYYSNPKLFGMDQATINNLEMGLAVVSLPILFKPNNLKVADKFKDSQRLTAFKEAAGNKYTSFKATMNDVNTMINPMNYRPKRVPELDYGFGSMRLNMFPQFQRVADEPFIQFSRRGSGGKVNEAYGGYYDRKEFRSKIYNAEYTPHGYKHLKAKTAEEAKRFSETGNKNAQYLPDANNKEIEKEALSKGYLIDNGNDNYYFIYDTGKVIGYDNGIPTQWIRAELTNGNVYHGHPISGDRLDKYLRKLGLK